MLSGIRDRQDARIGAYRTDHTIGREPTRAGDGAPTRRFCAAQQENTPDRHEHPLRHADRAKRLPPAIVGAR
jgi:hypothetical protein